MTPAKPADGAQTAIAAIVGKWRFLTGGTSRKISDLDRRTLVACSGGADSSALALALASATKELALAHVVHDLRPSDETARDRDAAASLAAKLDLPFLESNIKSKAQGGNEESTARDLRYAALSKLAKETGCRFVATAHHADDQLETMLMAIMRGAGPRGLAGIATSRSLEPGVTLIRPMLTATRQDAWQICNHSNWQWVEDETNSDTTRLRAALRSAVIPELERLRPGVAHRAGTAAELQAGAAELIDHHVADLFKAATRDETHITWQRRDLADQPPIILGALIRRSVDEICAGRGLDHLPSRTIDSISTAISDGKGQDRVFNLQSVTIQVTRAAVSVWGKV